MCGMVWGRRHVCVAFLIICPKYVVTTLSALLSDSQSAILVEGLA